MATIQRALRAEAGLGPAEFAQEQGEDKHEVRHLSPDERAEQLAANIGNFGAKVKQKVRGGFVGFMKRVFRGQEAAQSAIQTAEKNTAYFGHGVVEGAKMTGRDIAKSGKNVLENVGETYQLYRNTISEKKQQVMDEVIGRANSFATRIDGFIEAGQQRFQAHQEAARQRIAETNKNMNLEKWNSQATKLEQQALALNRLGKNSGIDVPDVQLNFARAAA